MGLHIVNPPRAGNNEPTFFDKITSGIGDAASDFFTSAVDKVNKEPVDETTIGGKLFAFFNLRTQERRQEITARAATRFRGSRFGSDFIDDIKSAEFVEFIKNPFVVIIGLMLTFLVVTIVVRR